MKSDPEISIIIPVYNVAPYLRVCLNSILSQSFGDFETIVINDGSTDNSGDIGDEYAQKDNRIKIYHQENRGISSALNIGLETAKGRWIYFVDGDDWLSFDALKRMVQCLDNNPEIDILGFNHFYNTQTNEYPNKAIIPHIFSLNEVFKLAAATVDPKFIEKKYNLSLPVFRTRWSKIFRRTIIYETQIKFNESLTLGEDAYFCTECFMQAQKVMLINEYLYHYRVYENSTINRYRFEWEHFFLKLRLINTNPRLNQLPDINECKAVLCWSGIKKILTKFLAHSQNPYLFKENKKRLNEMLEKEELQTFHISFSLVRYLPYYVPFLFFIKLKWATPLLILGKIIRRL